MSREQQSSQSSNENAIDQAAPQELGDAALAQAAAGTSSPVLSLTCTTGKHIPPVIIV